MADEAQKLAWAFKAANETYATGLSGGGRAAHDQHRFRAVHELRARPSACARTSAARRSAPDGTRTGTSQPTCSPPSPTRISSLVSMPRRRRLARSGASPGPRSPGRIQAQQTYYQRLKHSTSALAAPPPPADSDATLLTDRFGRIFLDDHFGRIYAWVLDSETSRISWRLRPAWLNSKGLARMCVRRLSLLAAALLILGPSVSSALASPDPQQSGVERHSRRSPHS